MDKEFQSFQDVITEYQEYFNSIGPKLLVALCLFLVFTLFAFLLRRLGKRVLAKRVDDVLLANFISGAVFWLFVIIGFSISLKTIGWERFAGGVIASAGIGAIVIGFAFKDIGENFLSGIFMAFSRPFKIGDTIDSNGVTGKVVSLNMRNTHIKTFDGKDTYIPNSAIIKNVLHNHTIDGFMRYHFDIGVDYSSDKEKAIEIVEEVICDISGVLNNHKKKPSVTAVELAASSMTIRVYFWIDTFDESVSLSRIKTQAMIRILKHMESAEINLPGTVIELRNYGNSKLDVVSG